MPKSETANVTTVTVQGLRDRGRRPATFDSGVDLSMSPENSHGPGRTASRRAAAGDGRGLITGLPAGPFPGPEALQPTFPDRLLRVDQGRGPAWLVGSASTVFGSSVALCGFASGSSRRPGRPLGVWTGWTSQWEEPEAGPSIPRGLPRRRPESARSRSPMLGSDAERRGLKL